MIENLQDRLADLAAATSWAELEFLGAQVDTQCPDNLRWDLGEGYELVCSPGHPKPPLASDGSIDHQRLRRAKVERVGKAG